MILCGKFSPNVQFIIIQFVADLVCILDILVYVNKNCLADLKSDKKQVLKLHLK